MSNGDCDVSGMCGAQSILVWLNSKVLLHLHVPFFKPWTIFLKDTIDGIVSWVLLYIVTCLLFLN